MSYYLHHVPGRLRVKSPLVRKNQEVAEEVENLLTLTPGVHSVKSNLTTGSILINYRPEKLDREDIIDLLSEKGYFDKSKAITNDEYFQEVTANTIDFLRRSILSDIIFALI
jgi:copper chaperone CopZ